MAGRAKGNVRTSAKGTAISDTLQSPSLDLAMAVGLVNALKDLIQEYRSESFVDNLWKDIVDTATQCSIAIENAKKKRSQKVSSRLDRSVITSTRGHRKWSDDGKKDTFREGSFISHCGHHSWRVRQAFL